VKVKAIPKQKVRVRAPDDQDRKLHIFEALTEASKTLVPSLETHAEEMRSRRATEIDAERVRREQLEEERYLAQIRAAI
jgi:hypothetical protein